MSDLLTKPREKEGDQSGAGILARDNKICRASRAIKSVLAVSARPDEYATERCKSAKRRTTGGRWRERLDYECCSDWRGKGVPIVGDNVYLLTSPSVLMMLTSLVQG